MYPDGTVLSKPQVDVHSPVLSTHSFCFFTHPSSKCL